MSQTNTRMVNVTLAAMTRVEYSAVVCVPDDATEEEIQELVNAMYARTDGSDFVDDPEYWERGNCYASSAEEQRNAQFQWSRSENGTMTLALFEDDQQTRSEKHVAEAAPLHVGEHPYDRDRVIQVEIEALNTALYRVADADETPDVWAVYVRHAGPPPLAEWHSDHQTLDLAVCAARVLAHQHTVDILSSGKSLDGSKM